MNGTRRYTEAELETLRRCWRTHTHSQLAEMLGRSTRGVSLKLWHMGLTGKGQPAAIRLTADRATWLRRNFPHVSNIVCATILGISVRSVVRIARKMGLWKTEEYMREAQAYTCGKARASHLANGTYPPKGVVNANLEKGAPYRFKPKASATW